MTNPQEREAAFIGKVTASATHELRNVLAIAKESAGLIEDVVSVSGQSGSPLTEKVMRAINRIRDQVERGSNLLTSLNRFAHSLDYAEDEIDMNDVAEQVSFLCQRKARQGRQSVKAEPGEEGVKLVTSPIHVQMALYAAVECCLEQLPEGGGVTIRTRSEGGRPSLEFEGVVEGSSVALAPTKTAAWPELAEVVADLGASVEPTEAGEGFRLVFSG